MTERGPNKKWTEDEKVQFLVRTIQDMVANGAKLSYGNVSDQMPGRTAKALNHLWDKLQKEYPAPGKATTASRKRTQETAPTGEGDAADEATLTPAAKRSRTTAGSKGKGKAVDEDGHDDHDGHDDYDDDEGEA
ncbi:hypothetical protein F5Y14DRAFT_451984 [Nemania sp. NC0429]|nr:hypothetical protein F5Y14DRAFT_451984 [Nemania sp. NC0429]